MKKKRLFATLLATVMVLTACGSEPVEKETEQSPSESSTGEAVVESQYPEYLNLESAYPIVKDEYADEITLRVTMLMQDNASEWEDLWISMYLKEKYNINLEVDYLNSANVEERKSLMLNTGELPDMMINLAMSTDDIMKYGAEEGLFLQMDQYMNETLTPNILKNLTGSAKDVCTAQDGHIYTLPWIVNQLNNNNFKRIHINRKWLNDLGYEMPRTLDEFVDAMYAIKEADPAGVGSENLYPFGSGDKMGFGNGWYILNALGYVEGTNISGDGYGILPALRDGEVVIPVYDMEVYQEYLKIMNKFYTDGIINPTFFTIEEVEMNAQMVEGKTAVYHNAPFVSGITNTEDWESLYPLTSQWQTEPEIAGPGYATPGNFLISADTEYPELCLRFAELFFNNDTDIASMFQDGPYEGYEWSLGFPGRIYNEEKKSSDWGEFPEGIENGWQYQVEGLFGNIWMFGAAATDEGRAKYCAEMGREFVPIQKGTWTDSNYFSNSVYTNMEPYVADSFPTTYYLTSEQSERMKELTTIITPYVEEQVAAFITGRRPLSETGKFVEELEGLGIEEMLNIYKAVYESLK